MITDLEDDMSLGCSGIHLSVVLIVFSLLSCSAEPPVGNVGCLFSGLVCGEYEVCFNDLVIGRCVSASSNNQHLTRLGPLSGPPLGLLEAELSRVFGLGFSWPDLYTQCVFQTLIHSIENRLPYYKQQCSHILGTQRLLPVEEENDLDDEDNEEEYQQPDIEELDEDNNDEDGDQQLFIPQGNLRYGDDFPEDGDTEAFSEEDLRDLVNNNDYLPYEDETSPDDESTAFSQLQQVLNGLPTSEQLSGSRHVLIPLENYPQDPEGNLYVVSPNELQYLPEVIQQEDNDYSTLPLLYSPYSSDQEDFPMNNFHQNLPDERQDQLPIELIQPSTYYSPQQQQQAYFQLGNNEDPREEYLEDDIQRNHPVEKREVPTDDEDDSSSLATSYNIPVAPNLDTEPKDADYDVPENYQNKPFHPVDRENLDNDYDDEDSFVDDSEQSYWKPNEDSSFLLPRTNQEDDDDVPSDNDESYKEDSDDDNVSNYDFDYADSSADPEEEDILYYNPENDQIEMESVFDRRGRLDVKKPGPFFTNSPNNFFLDKLLPESKDDVDDDKIKKDYGQTEYEESLQPSKHKKDLQESIASFTEPDNNQDNYLHVNIKDRFTSLGQANKLADFIADHLQVKRKVFTEFRPEQSRLLLKVNSNPQGLNATSMADKLASDPTIRQHASQDLGVDIDNFAAGGKDSVISIYNGPPSRLFLLLFILTAGLASLLIVVAVLLLLRRRARMKTKVVETKEEKEEPVKEYKQLVRDWSRSSRASGSNSSSGGVEGDQEKGGAGIQSPVKVALKRGSQNSDGSRTSSTSSWQEEPGVTTMDISTGHMVLSYMEDHLKNKQRLEQEWVGLCAYEAEPNSTSVAFKVENKKKNRYPDKLPYDHNRVLLNALVNGSNSDYINASTVMDHDPRNPAYIITQGPLAHTVADFWQMVWEQGSVVIVMLSRLQENGYHLAHRYWPEEGSEQFHIFEVHLVSEHVWCEDYLVRSLYLKNTQTGETRTVTQFHFLSWPDSNIPTSTRAILEFRRKVNKSYRGRSCPMIIHCSDGVGRSGTYVLIDMVLNRMTKGSKEIDIAATLEHIRDQRSGMVQTRSQFEFCLMAVAEETHAILKALPQ